MDKESYMPKITAPNVQEFEELYNLIEKLPQNIIDQIESAEGSLIGCKCIFKKQFTDRVELILPPCGQISDFGDYIGFYCDEYFFVYHKHDKDKGKKEMPQFRFLFHKPEQK